MPQSIAPSPVPFAFPEEKRMEFTLDVARVREILTREREQALADISAVGPISAVETSGHRHDQRIAEATDVQSLACKTGCSWCCYFTVDVRAAEVFRIVEYIDVVLPPEQVRRIRSEVRENSTGLRLDDELERIQQNIRCPFLSEHQCLVYPVRPQACRNYHATDAVGCERSYLDPEDLDIDPEFAPGVYQAGAAHVEAFGLAMRTAGYDDRVYELNRALHAALSDGAARQRFEAGRQPFPEMRGDTVSVEFDDLLS